MSDDTKQAKTYDVSDDDEYERYPHRVKPSREPFNTKLDSLCKQINAGKTHKQWVCSHCNRMKDKHEFTHHIENDPLLFYKMKCNLCWIEAGKYIP